MIFHPRFMKKSAMRIIWLKENQEILTRRNFGTTLASVDAATQKHEALENEIASFEERVRGVVDVADELENEGYEFTERILERKEEVVQNWNHLYNLLKDRQTIMMDSSHETLNLRF